MTNKKDRYYGMVTMQALKEFILKEAMEQNSSTRSLR
jgi:hypothetical protein